jgi:hypothetical protein
MLYTGLDPEIGEAAYEFYCAMAARVESYRNSSMEHYRKFWAEMKQLPKPEALVLFHQEMDRQLHQSGIELYDF